MPAVTVTADQEGRFAFDALPAGGFRVSASSGGYQTGYFAQQSASDSLGGNARIDLAAGERLTDVTIRLWRGASISGRVTDERGNPIVGSVQVLERQYIAGQLSWVPRRTPWATDSQGAYVVADLTPGDYVVALVGKPSVGGAAGHAPVFFPASARASTATVVTLVSGESRTDINFSATLTPPADAVPVSGRLVGDGSPLPLLTLRLVPADASDGLLDVEALTAETSATGEFRFSRVPVGQYRLLASVIPLIPGVVSARFASFDGFSWSGIGNRSQALNPVPATPTWVVDRIVTVDKSLENLDLPLQRGARIHGRALFEGDGPLPGADALIGMPVFVRPAHMRDLGRIPLGGVDADGRFHTVGLPPGSYVLTMLTWWRGPQDLRDWHVASVRVAGRETTGNSIELGTTDLTDVELVFSKRPMQLSGVVRGLDGRPVPWARVILFPRDPALWGDYVAFPAERRIRQIVTDRFGAFDGAWVPSGDYLLAAAAAVPKFWMAPEYLQTLVTIATPVRIELGGQQSIDLRLR